jgi:iron complex outermembrane receptor protein
MKYSLAAVTGSICAALAISSLPAPSFAQDEGALEEITVTAQFREQSVQDTPIAITAISGDTLEERSQLAVPEIAAQAPNVTMTQGGAFGGNSLTAYIRGVGQIDFIPAVEPGVGIYVDDVYYASITGAVLELLDLDRVEILRGPQGTLAGKNSIGGALKLYSKKPSGDPDGFVEAGFGEYDAVRVRAATNFTLIEDKMWGRVSGTSMSRDGYVTNLDYGCTHPNLGLNFPVERQIDDCVTGTEGGIDYTAARLAFRYMPSDDLQFDLSFNIVDEDSDPIPNVPISAGPTTAPVLDFSLGPPYLVWDHPAGGFDFGYLYGGTEVGSAPGCMFIAWGSASCDPLSPDNLYVNYATYDDYRSGVTIRREKTLEARDLTFTISYLFGDNMNFKSITSFRKLESGWGQDEDGTPIPLGYLYQFVDQEQMSQEFRLSGGSPDSFDWTVGAFYHNSETPVTGRIGLGYVGFDFLHGPDPLETTNTAAFANATFYVGESVEINAGVRFSDDEKDYAFQRRNPDLSEIQPCIGPPGTPGNPPNCLISEVNGESASFSDTRTDYRLALSYKVSESALVYGSYSTGYKGGGGNPRPFFNAQITSVAPEELDTFEVGYKGDFADGRARLNAAYFINDYSNIQAQFSFCPQFPGFEVPCLATLNAGDADVDGFEIEFDAAIGDNFLLEASYASLNFDWTSVVSGADVDPDGITPFSPETTWSLGLQFTQGNFMARLDANYQDDIFTEANNQSGSFIGDYTLLNGSIALRSPDDRWLFKLEGKNLSDEEYLYYVQDGSSEGIDYAAPALPRTWMFSARRNFN